jgi:hypothetical protein
VGRSKPSEIQACADERLEIDEEGDDRGATRREAKKVKAYRPSVRHDAELERPGARGDRGKSSEISPGTTGMSQSAPNARKRARRKRPLAARNRLLRDRKSGEVALMSVRMSPRNASARQSRRSGPMRTRTPRIVMPTPASRRAVGRSRPRTTAIRMTRTGIDVLIRAECPGLVRKRPSTKSH